MQTSVTDTDCVGTMLLLTVVPFGKNCAALEFDCQHCKVTLFTLKSWISEKKKDFIISEYLKARSLNNSLACAFMDRQFAMLGGHDTFFAKKMKQLESQTGSHKTVQQPS
jgi:hypothetical protein